MAEKHYATEKHETAESLLQQLEERVTAEILAGNVYEALQYVQSFIARKKKTLGQRGTSQAVFLGARTLLKDAIASVSVLPSASSPLTAEALTLASNCGALLRWFIEDGAGPENQFHLLPDQIHAGVYCDVQHLLDLLSSLDVRVAGPVVDATYLPFHLHVAKTKVKRHSHLSQRVNRLETLFARVLQSNKRWLLAFKALVRLQDAEQVAALLNEWASEGYANERPLFFARALLQILSENKTAFAKDVLHASLRFVEDNVQLAPTQSGAAPAAPAHAPGDSHSASLAVWHVAVILTELVNFPPMPRVDKTKLFGLLHRRYGALFLQVDIKLLEIFLKVGEACFRYVLESPTSNTPSPMAMLQSLLTGGQSNAAGPNGANKKAAPGPDFSQLMSMMSKLQGKM